MDWGSLSQFKSLKKGYDELSTYIQNYMPVTWSLCVENCVTKECKNLGQWFIACS